MRHNFGENGERGRYTPEEPRDETLYSTSNVWPVSERTPGGQAQGERTAGERPAGDQTPGERTAGEQAPGERAPGEQPANEQPASEGTQSEQPASGRAPGEWAAGERVTGGSPLSSDFQSYSGGSGSSDGETLPAETSYPAGSAPVGGKAAAAPRAKNNSLRVFIAVMCVFLAVAVAASVGYFVGGRQKPSSGGYSTGLAAKPGKSELSPAQEVYAEQSPSVVGILVYSEKTGAVSQASGVVYSDDGYIVTNDHVYSDIPTPKFKICNSEGEIFDAEYVAGDSRSDIAVLRTDATGLKPATFADPKELLVGENVIAVGYPAGIYERPIMTAGTVSSVGRRITSSTTSYSIRLIQTDTAINPGNSGGALFNLYGQVAGITSSKIVGESYDRVGFAIPADTVVKIADSLINNGHVEGRARLGITYVAVDIVAAEINNCPSGLQVASVSEESDLYGKDIAAGDIITHLNDTEITDSVRALDIIDSLKPGDTVTLTVYRTTGETVTLTATMLNDPGTSSYTDVVSDSPDGNSSGGNTDPFDFPFGE